MDYGIVNINGMLNNKYVRTVRAVKETMSQYGMSRPLTTEYKKYLNRLPKTSDGQRVLKQIKCSKFPKSEHEIAGKLNDLYVYSEVAKSLESDAITLAIRKSLKTLDDEFPPPGRRQRVTPTIIKVDPSKIKMTKPLEVEQRLRKDLDKYSRVGAVKKMLYSMPEYIRDRDRKGVKLPVTKHKSPSYHSDLNISKVRVSNTKVGRVYFKQTAKRKKMENLKQMLNPFGKKFKSI